MPNDMRDRLIELYDQTNDECDRKDCLSCKYWNASYCRVHKFIDKIIANGAILPPCKVGDKVYFDTYLHGDSVGVQSHKVINVKYIIITEPSKGGIGAEIPDYAFGKTVFLALEEAEKEIKDGAEE